MRHFFQLILYVVIFSLAWNTYASTLIQREQAFIFFANHHKDSVPDSYQYIQLEYKNIPKDSELEDALQILIYLDLIKNAPVDIYADKAISIYMFEILSEKILWIQVGAEQNDIDKKNIYTSSDDLKAIKNLLEKRASGIKINSWLSINPTWTSSLGEKSAILEDVYETISDLHYDRSELEENQLVEWAIRGIAESTWDKYTTYFPPVESEDFFQWLDGEYEWIGSYVEMPSPWNLTIVSPIVGSPSEKAVIRWWDRITHVDDKEISEDKALREVISWIKWPAGSQVKLTIYRESDNSTLDILVTRAKIVIKDIEHEKLNNNTYYIRVKNFWENVDTEFKAALEALSLEVNVDKVIFDLRNNPGWYLGEVSTMLSYFVEKSSPTAIVDYGNREIKYSSRWYDLIDFTNYELIFLQNSGSASASEIMVGTIKDYYPDSVIIGEQSFGKWSVQSLKTYYDGSTLKYTAAKWFTWRTKQGIDGVWITPDIQLEFDSDRWERLELDNQLERALSY